MSKTPTEAVRHALNGPTMGTRWSAVFHAPAGFDPAPVFRALGDAVATVDAQMSTWKPDSDLMRLNRAPLHEWQVVPHTLFEVVAAGLEIGRLSGGAFDIGMGDAVAAWGFGPAPADPGAMRAALQQKRSPAHEVLDLDPATSRIRKRAPLALDLSGIAKGHAVDRMAETLGQFRIRDALVSIDGELRALGLRPDGRPWTVAIERPDDTRRAPVSMLELSDCAVATSGDYRHWVRIGGRRLAHTMDPARGAPLAAPPASVTVLAQTCMAADAWATALTVLGREAGGAAAGAQGLRAIFIERAGGGEEAFRTTSFGFDGADPANGSRPDPVRPASRIAGLRGGGRRRVTHCPGATPASGDALLPPGGCGKQVEDPRTGSRPCPASPIAAR